MQICVMLYEAQPITQTYGTIAFTVSLFCLVYLHAHTLCGAYGDASLLIYWRTINWCGEFGDNIGKQTSTILQAQCTQCLSSPRRPLPPTLLFEQRWASGCCACAEITLPE